MDIDRALALALARRLDPVTPPGVRVLAWAEEETVIIGCDDGPPLVFVGMAGGVGPELFAYQLLDNVQEFVIENVVHGGWPPIDPERPHDRQTASALPAARAALDEDELYLWFGERDRPSLALRPVTVDELGTLREEAEHGDDDLVHALWSDSIRLHRQASAWVAERARLVRRARHDAGPR
jgi:hypothetical protein